MNITPFRKLIVGAVGIALVSIGLVGLVLPFLPGWLLIVGGLALLSTEYVWARRLADGAKRHATAMTRRRQEEDELAA